MKKIPTVFRRDPNDMAHVLPEINPGCEWALLGEGTATRKYDGTCTMLDAGGRWWARREVKTGRPVPPRWVSEDYDPATGKSVGWVPIGESGWAKWHAEAAAPMEEFGALIGQAPPPGTYELIGPKINGNPEGAEHHRLERHATAEQLGLEAWTAGPELAVKAFDALRVLLVELAEDRWEGVVWHHPDGRMAKLKRRDFPR